MIIYDVSRILLSKAVVIHCNPPPPMYLVIYCIFHSRSINCTFPGNSSIVYLSWLESCTVSFIEEYQKNVLCKVWFHSNGHAKGPRRPNVAIRYQFP